MKCPFLCAALLSLGGASAQPMPDASLLDPNFNPNLQMDGGIADLALTSSGKILVTGSFDTIDGIPAKGIAQLHDDGTLDTSFSANHLGLGHAGKLVIQPDGKILVAASREGSNDGHPGLFTTTVLRLLPDGGLDQTFHVPTIGGVADLDSDSEGRIYIGGRFYEVDGVRRVYLARLLPNGTLDQTFQPAVEPHGSAEGGMVRVAVQPDDKVVLAGVFFSPLDKHYLARFNENGSDDASFSASSLVPTFCNALEVIADGRILHGWGWRGETGINAGIRRYLPDRSLDETFKHDTEIDGTVTSFAVQPDGKVITGISSISLSQRQLVRFHANGRLDQSFDPGGGFFPGEERNGSRIQGYISKVLLDASGNILVGGTFSSYNGTARTNLVRLLGERVYLKSITRDEPGFIKFVWRVTEPQLEYLVQQTSDLKQWSPLEGFSRVNDEITLLAPSSGGREFFRLIAVEPD